MQRVVRILQLLRELPRGRGCPQSTARALAERLGVSERSIYRDLEAIGEAGFAVTTQGEGYYLLATDQTIPVELTSAQLASLLYAAGLVREALPPALGEQMQRALDRLAAACGSDEALRAALDPDGGIQVRLPTTDGPGAVTNLELAIRARRTHRKLQGRYRSPESDRESLRTIHPYAITYRGEAHYLVGYCELRGEVRTFRLDRFRNLRVLDQTADIPWDYDLEHHFSGAWHVTGGRAQRVRIRFRGLAARRLASAQVHPSQQVHAEGPEQSVLELRVAITEELRGWILSLGPEAEVVAPRSLRDQVAQTAGWIADNYRPT